MYVHALHVLSQFPCFLKINFMFCHAFEIIRFFVVLNSFYHYASKPFVFMFVVSCYVKRLTNIGHCILEYRFLDWARWMPNTLPLCNLTSKNILTDVY
jgi:hypothetical protein